MHGSKFLCGMSVNGDNSVANMHPVRCVNVTVVNRLDTFFPEERFGHSASSLQLSHLTQRPVLHPVRAQIPNQLG